MTMGFQNFMPPYQLSTPTARNVRALGPALDIVVLKCGEFAEIESEGESNPQISKLSAN